MIVHSHQIEPDVCCQDLVLLVEPYNLLEAERNVDFENIEEDSGFGLTILTRW